MPLDPTRLVDAGELLQALFWKGIEERVARVPATSTSRKLAAIELHIFGKHLVCDDPSPAVTTRSVESMANW